MINVRLHFSKTFEAKYISHLDLARCFSRALKKSGLDLWYTEGFNTRLYVTFALPLSLGLESLCETVDIRLINDEFDPNIVYAVNPQLPKGIEVFDANIPVFKAGDIAFARYLVELCDGKFSSEDVLSAVHNVINKDAIMVKKTNKKGIVKDIDIKPLIHSSRAFVQGEMCYLDLTLGAGNENSLNPNLLLSEAFSLLGRETDHILIKRTQILTKNLENFR